MDKRQYGRYIANETLEIFKSGQYRTRKGSVNVKDMENYMIANTQIYSPETGNELIVRIEISGSENGIIEVTYERTLQASKRLITEGYKDVACLNFASAKYPGGGFLSGAYAQEESLARASGLYPSIALKKEMYNYNIRNGTPLYSDYMIYSPKVPVIRDDNLDLLEAPYCVSMITSPAVNIGAIRDKNELMQTEGIMRKRIEKILAIAAEHNEEAVVLGAFGCGVFKQNLDNVAQYFYDALYKKGYITAFKKIVFAIYGSSTNYEAFKNVFKKYIE